MANASGVNEYADLKKYSMQLHDAAEDLSNIINNILYRIEDIIENWDDKDQEVLNDLIEEKAPIVYQLSADLWNYGEFVQQYATDNEEIGSDFHHIVKNI